MEENNNFNETEQEKVDENATVQEEAKVGEVVEEDGYSTKEKEDGKMLAILSYIGILALVPYLVEKENKWVKYHALQGINLFIIEVILCVIGMIPLLGWLIGWIGNIVMLVVSIIGIINVCNGEVKELPIVGSIKFIKR